MTTPPGQPKRSQQISASELMAQLAGDEAYQAKKAAFDSELEARREFFASTERSIVADLQAAGVHVESVWDLVDTSDPYPDALSILLRHLELGGYPDRVMESMGRALAVAPSAVFWDRLEALCIGFRSPGEQDGMAVALAACATPDRLDHLTELVSDPSHGESRIYFIRPILNLGAQHGREIVEGLRADPELERESWAALSGRAPNR